MKKQKSEEKKDSRADKVQTVQKRLHSLSQTDMSPCDFSFPRV